MTELPSALEKAKQAEKEFGVPPITYFNRHFSSMIQKARNNPREAMVHAMKAEEAVIVNSFSSDKEYSEIRGLFRSARTKIAQGLYSSLLETLKEISKKLRKEGMGVSPTLKGE